MLWSVFSATVPETPIRCAGGAVAEEIPGGMVKEEEKQKYGNFFVRCGYLPG